MTPQSHAAMAASSAPAPPRSAFVAVWDPVVRVFHWTVVAGFATNMVVNEDAQSVHRWIGYVVMAAVLLRLLWGFVGTTHARFSDFIPTPKRLRDYGTALLAGREQRYIGHNPAAALMMTALMTMLVMLGVTGWMMGLDAFWGEEWLENLHEAAANLTLLLVGIHIVAAVVESLRHRENLIWAMITGRKRPAGDNDIDHASASRRG